MLVASQIICETFSMSQGRKPNSTFNTQHSTFNTQHSTLNIQHSTLNIKILEITDIKRTRNGKRIVQFSL